MTPEIYGTPLFDEAEQVVQQEVLKDGTETEVIGHTRKKGRKPLPKDLPRETIINDLSDEEKICPIYGEKLVKIGESKSQKLEIIPSAF